MQDFVASLSCPVRSFPPGLRNTYLETIASFREDAASRGFDVMSTRQGFADRSPSGVAHRMYLWYPTHFFKFQDSILSGSRSVAYQEELSF